MQQIWISVPFVIITWEIFGLHLRPQPGVGGSTQPSFIQLGSASRSKPLSPYLCHFDRKYYLKIHIISVLKVICDLRSEFPI